jgi:hypothetical protein
VVSTDRSLRSLLDHRTALPLVEAVAQRPSRNPVRRAAGMVVSPLPSLLDYR